MTFQTENLIKLYREIISEVEDTDIDMNCFEIMIKSFRDYGVSINSKDLSAFSLYLIDRFPILGYITRELVNQQFDKVLIELSDLEIRLYVTLCKNYKKNEQRFNI